MQGNSANSSIATVLIGS